MKRACTAGRHSHTAAQRLGLGRRREIGDDDDDPVVSPPLPRPCSARGLGRKNRPLSYLPCSDLQAGKEDATLLLPSLSKKERLEERSKTNLRNKGLISADRRTRPTLMLTIPRSLVKSSTKDLSFPTVGIVFQRTLVGHLGGLECVAIL